MSQWESVKAFGKNINERKQKLIAGGMSNQQAEDEVQKLLAEKQVTPDFREARGLVRGFGRMGVELGGFQRFDAIEANTPLDYEKRQVKDYEGSEGGQQALRDADTALADAKAGARNVRIAEIRQEAETQLKNEGRFERFDASDLGRKATEKIGGLLGAGTPSAREQLINERALENTYRETGAPTNKLTHYGSGDYETNKQILKALEYQNKLIEEDLNRREGRPLPSAMPPGVARR